MTIPRFVFVAGVGQGMSAHPLWPGPLYPFNGTSADDGSWIAWRLTGGNHRELGRSAQVFADLESAKAHATTLRQRIEEADTEILIVPPVAGWGWRVVLDGEAIATSSRAYPRERECMQSVRAFVDAAAVAIAAAGPTPRTRHTAPHHATQPQAEEESVAVDTDVITPG